MTKWILTLAILLSLSVNAFADWSAVTYNIRNFEKKIGMTDTKLLGSQLKELNSDVFAFVEVANKVAFKDLMKNNLPQHQHLVSSCGGAGNQYLAVAYNPNTFKFISYAEDMKFTMSGSSMACGSLRPAFIVALEHKETKKIYNFIVGHLKAGGDSKAFKQRWQQYLLLKDVLSVYQDKNYVLMGDLNTTGFNIKDEDGQKFMDLLSDSSSYSVSETLECTSYWDGADQDPALVSSILDHIIVSNSQKSSIKKIELGSHCAKMDCKAGLPSELGDTYAKVSDHCPIKVTFDKSSKD